MITVIYWNNKKNHLLFEDSSEEFVESLKEILNLRRVTIENYFSYQEKEEK